MMGAYYTGPEWAKFLAVLLLLVVIWTCVSVARENARERERRDRKREYARRMADSQDWYRALPTEDRRA